LYQHTSEDYNKKVLYDLTNDYQYFNGFYKNRLNDNWSARGGISFTCLQNAEQIENANMEELQKGLHVKTVVEGSLSDRIELRSGIEVIDRAYDQIVASDSSQKYSFHEAVTSVFIEGDIYASNAFVVRTGGRLEHNNLIDRVSIDPRISLAYKIGTHGQASIAYGKFRQSVRNEFLRINHNLEAERADHYILNYQVIKDKRTFRMETFYKRYHKLVKFIDGDHTNLTNLGNGDAMGIELFWRDNASINRLDYWISYSYLDTKRNYLDFPYDAMPSFASKHNFSLVTKYFVQKIKSQLGFTYSFASARPYNNPNADSFNGGRTPNYADLSFNWSYLPTTSLIIHFSCSNLLGRDNIFGYEYSRTPLEDGTFASRAVRQPAPRFLFLGIFITLSKDKSVNQLPSL
jgi:outer membrane cobalamin receptor